VSPPPCYRVGERVASNDVTKAIDTRYSRETSNVVRKDGQCRVHALAPPRARGPVDAYRARIDVDCCGGNPQRQQRGIKSSRRNRDIHAVRAWLHRSPGYLGNCSHSVIRGQGEYDPGRITHPVERIDEHSQIPVEAQYLIVDFLRVRAVAMPDVVGRR
jgi:hypothetical protein